MIGHGDGAVLALHRLTARAAEHDGGVATSVQQHHDLLAALQPVGDFLNQLPGEDLVFSRLLKLSRMSRSSTSGSGRCSTRSGSSSSRYFPASAL